MIRLALLMIVGMVLETLGIGLVLPAIGILVKGNLTTSYPQMQSVLAALGHPSQQALVIWFMVGLMALYLIKSLFLGWLTWQQSRFAYDVAAGLSYRLFFGYLRQPYAFHLQRNSAQLLRNITGEVSQFAFSGALPALVLATELLVVLGVSTLLVVVEPAGAVIVGVILGGAMWIFHRVTSAHLVRWGTQRQFHDGQRLQQLQEGLGAIKDVILLRRGEYFLTHFDVHNKRSARIGERIATFQTLPRYWLELLAAIGIASMVIVMVAQGKALASILPTLGLFAAAGFRLMPSGSRIVGALASLKYGVPVIDTLRDELGTFESARPAADVTPVAHFSGEIELTDVSFQYEQAPRPALTSLSLKIGSGETIGLVGTSGAGKSTLVNIILGLLEPTSGSVRVDGRPLEDCINSWRSQLGYVPQSIYLTDDTLRRNVAFGVPDSEIDERAVRRAISAAQLDELVDSNPQGLDVFVGERGVRLSGGQQQRIGIARALYRDPPVLVLDEATSALDTVTEGEVMDAVAALRGSRTIVIATHRLSTVAEADRIIRLAGGRIVAQGPPAEMIAGGALLPSR